MAPPSWLSATASLLFLVLAAPYCVRVAEGQYNSTGNKSTQLYCIAENVPSNTPTYEDCLSYLNTVYNVTSGMSGYSVGLAPNGIFSTVSVGAVSVSILVAAADIPAAGGNIVVVSAVGPNFSLAAVSAAVAAGTISTLQEPLSSALVVLNITFGSTTSSPRDSSGLRVPDWRNTRVSAITGLTGFQYIPPTNASDAYYYWSTTSPNVTTLKFYAGQWDTDPRGAIYMTAAINTSIPIAVASSDFKDAYYFRNSTLDAAPRALPNAALQLVVASAVMLLCVSSIIF